MRRRDVATTLAAAAGVGAALAVWHRSLATLLALGGSCADNGPFVVARPCPDHLVALLLGAFFGGLACLVVFVAAGSRLCVDHAAGLVVAGMALPLAATLLWYARDPLRPSWVIGALAVAGLGVVTLRSSVPAAGRLRGCRSSVSAVVRALPALLALATVAGAVAGAVA